MVFTRSSHRKCSVKKGVLKNFAKFTGKHLCQSLFLIKLYACNFIKKESLAQIFSYEFCEMSKNTIFTEHLQTTVFVLHSQMLWVKAISRLSCSKKKRNLQENRLQVCNFVKKILPQKHLSVIFLWNFSEHPSYGTPPRSSHPRYFIKNIFIKKGTLAQLFSWEFCEIFKNTYLSLCKSSFLWYLGGELLKLIKTID